jgi:hypothetical protein
MVRWFPPVVRFLSSQPLSVAVAEAPSASAALSARLTACGTLAELGVLVSAHAREMNALHEALIISQCEALGSSAGARELFLSSLARWLARPQAERTGRAAAGILHVASVLNVRGPTVRVLLREAARLAPTLSHAGAAARGLAAAAALGAGSDARPLVAAALRLLPSAPPGVAHTCFHAVARLGEYDKRVTLPFAEAAARDGGGAPGDAARSLWAAARLGYGEGERERAASGAFAAAAARGAATLAPGDAAHALWAVAKLATPELGAGAAVPLAAAAARGAASLDAPRIAMALWAVGRLAGNGGGASALPAAPFVSGAVNAAGALNAPGAAASLWALARLDVTAPAAVAPILAAAAREAPRFSPQDAADALWAAARLALPLASSAPLLAAGARTAPANANATNAATALWAAAALGEVEPGVLGPLGDAVARLVGRVKAPQAHALLQAVAAGAVALPSGCVAQLRTAAAAGGALVAAAGGGGGGGGARARFRAAALAALAPLGLAVAVDVPLCDGLLRADCVVAGRVAVVLEQGRAFFLPPAAESSGGDLAPPPVRRPTPLADRMFLVCGLSRVNVALHEWTECATDGARAALLRGRVQAALAAHAAN